MDKKGHIQEHSKIKLQLYKLYLERYLSVLLVTSFFKSIVVNDVFAGSGISKNEEKGSAVIAAEIINKFKNENNKHGKQILLNLNDADPVNCSSLQSYLKSYSFISLTNQNANQYIHSWNPIADSHNLFFIDPHGYTQVTIENLKRLFSMERCDFLIFVPINHIYRFLRKEEDMEQLKPIANFLRDLGINESDAARIDSVEDFANLVVNSLRKISDTDWVYKEILENRSRNSKYCLFFITRNILGAEKFLEAQLELRKIIKANEAQATFDFVDDLDKRSILEVISKGRPYDNIELYELGIQNGILSGQLGKELKNLEKNGKVTAASFAGKERKKQGFYINYKNFRSKDKMVSIIFRG